MIERYTKPEMGRLWTTEARFEKMKEVELAVAHVQGQMGIIPKKAAADIKKNAKVKVKRILKIEEKTKHDVIAFVSQLAEEVGDNGRYIHFGLTSSDVLDTALSLQMKESFLVLHKQWKDLDQVFKSLIRKNANALCAGRTHGMQGEPTSFGYKLCGFHAEFRRNVKRLKLAFQDNFICKLSGAVGTYNSQPITMEKKVAKALGLSPETIATQVVPRDRHSNLLYAFASYAAGMERLCIELRHLQRTEVGEVFEGFSKGQKGSSAMPHKKNPITAENVTGLSRMTRAYVQTGLENISLWHERDLSHSSTERVFFADAFVLHHYMNFRIKNLLENLVVDKVRMRKNLDLSQGKVYSSQLLLALVKKSWKREKAYELVQSLSLKLSPKQNLLEACLLEPALLESLSVKELDQIFSGKILSETLKSLVKKYLESLSKERI